MASSLTGDPSFAFFDKSAYYANGDPILRTCCSDCRGRPVWACSSRNPRPAVWEGHAFVQDAWCVTSRLTLTYGVRYEYQAPFAEANGQAANVGLTTMSLLLADRGANASLISPDRNNLAPRLGAAW